MQTGRYEFSKIPFFAQKLTLNIIDNKYRQLFSLNCQAYLVHFGKNVCHISRLNNHNLLVILASTNGVPCKKKKKKGSLAQNSISQVLLLDIRIRRKCFPFHHHTGYKKQVSSSRDLIKSIMFLALLGKFLNETGFFCVHVRYSLLFHCEGGSVSTALRDMVAAGVVWGSCFDSCPHQRFYPPWLFLQGQHNGKGK